MAGLLNDFSAGKLVIPHQLELLNDSVLLVRLTESGFRNHSFLDQRILHQGTPHEWLPWKQFETAAEALTRRVPGYIFHIGHCGSTLLSRLVSAATGTLAIREPLPLRTIAIDKVDSKSGYLSDEGRRARLELFERAWSRGAEKTVIKATSICTNIMSVVSADAPRVFMYQQPRTHLAVVLAGENKLQDLRGFAQNRHRRLAAFDADLPPLAELGVAELAALSWLAEIVSAHQSVTDHAIHCVDFDGFLRQPREILAAVCKHLGLETDSGRCDAALAGRIMQTYSKAPEYNYGPELRAEVIAESLQINSSDIALGLDWIDRVAASSAALSAAVTAFAAQ